MRNLLILLVLATLASAGCRPTGDRSDAEETGSIATGGAAASGDGGDPVKPGAEKATPQTLPTNAVTTDATPESAAAENLAEPAGNGVAAAPAPADSTIPQQYRGRWGMVQADCASALGNAKGLLTVDSRALRSFETASTLKERLPAIATGFSGRFEMEGAGPARERTVTLTRDGDQLTRADEQSTVTYTLCPS